jgi:hypothetical protein
MLTSQQQAHPAQELQHCEPKLSYTAMACAVKLRHVRRAVVAGHGKEMWEIQRALTMSELFRPECAPFESGEVQLRS